MAVLTGDGRCRDPGADRPGQPDDARMRPRAWRRWPPCRPRCDAAEQNAAHDRRPAGCAARACSRARRCRSPRPPSPPLAPGCYCHPPSPRWRSAARTSSRCAMVMPRRMRSCARAILTQFLPISLGASGYGRDTVRRDHRRAADQPHAAAVQPQPRRHRRRPGHPRPAAGAIPGELGQCRRRRACAGRQHIAACAAGGRRPARG